MSEPVRVRIHHGIYEGREGSVVSLVGPPEEGEHVFVDVDPAEPGAGSPRMRMPVEKLDEDGQLAVMELENLSVLYREHGTIRRSA